MLVSSLCSNGTRTRLADILLGSCRKLSTRPAFSSTSRPIVGLNFRSAGVRNLSSYPPGVSRTTAAGSPRTYAAIAERQPKPATAVESAPLPVLSPPSVGKWLLGSAALVFAIVVVGGVTRLTESGLSITEWKPITGILPPLSRDDWNAEFDKYKATPEFKLMNHSMTLNEFKSIFYMEWGHRVLGRVIGVAFVVPLAYFYARKKLTRALPAKLTGLAVLIGFQGLLGWYMVKSGLEDSIMEDPNGVPRVSQYRLAAHLGTALLLYVGMLGTGIAVVRDWRWAHGGSWSGAAGWKEVLSSARVRRFKGFSWALAGLVFLTALSGAFVAGLDAGLVYNEFPYMGERIVPPTDELFTPLYAKNADGSDLWWRNILENPTTVQFDHRAVSTYVATTLMFLHSLRPSMRAILPKVTRGSIHAAFAMVNVQVVLGISTLLYLVPVPLAAAHQAGSVALLSTMVFLVGSLRRPGAAARAWRQWGKAAASKEVKP
ncbi:COX15-CtaA-domain-containing protein [Athelia psychrophila]|uniref:COX15-CtaA-domain-containing protein n=1 Tax=Athelia psychrophila TaxID=1759441 RepID=A0A166BXH4_9AGAM|nr:COX15-CtaA-domain-containing protein [Fibularhizoctonia sp. CBS 109695]